jgi:colicin import membrane protein
MNNTLSYIISATLAIGFHAAVVGLLMVNWEGEEPLESPPVEKYYIEANLVDENPFDAKAREEQTKKDRERRNRVKKKQAIDKKNARLRMEAIELAKKKSLEEQLAKQRKLEEQRAIELAKQKNIQEAEDKARASSDVEREAMERSLAMSIREEQGARRAVTDDEKAMAYVSQIQRDIIGNWSRPPSARNGMQALLRVILVPTGEVVDVVVEKGSGNDAFDRSAILAVRKAQRFQVPSQSRQFERDFREFTVLFRPEDLRL